MRNTLSVRTGGFQAVCLIDKRIKRSMSFYEIRGHHARIVEIGERCARMRCTSIKDCLCGLSNIFNYGVIYITFVAGRFGVLEIRRFF